MKNRIKWRGYRLLLLLCMTSCMGRERPLTSMNIPHRVERSKSEIAQRIIALLIVGAKGDGIKPEQIELWRFNVNYS